MSLFDLSGRVALVSGAASGMGKAMSLALAEHGADLMLADLNTEGLEQTAEEIRSRGRRAVAVTCNVSHYGPIRELPNTDGLIFSGMSRAKACSPIRKRSPWSKSSRCFKIWFSDDSVCVRRRDAACSGQAGEAS